MPAPRLLLVVLSASLGCSTLLGRGPTDEGSFAYRSKPASRLAVRNAFSVEICEIHLWKKSPEAGNATEADDWLEQHTIPPGGHFDLAVVKSDAVYSLRAFACPAGFSGPAIYGRKPEGGKRLFDTSDLVFSSNREVDLH